MPPDQSNLPEGVEVWTIYSPTGDGSTGYVALHGDYVAEHPGAILVYYDLPAIIEQARQEEREKLLRTIQAELRRLAHQRRSNYRDGRVAALHDLHLAILDLNPDSPG